MFTLKIVNQDETVRCEEKGEKEVILVYRQEYQEGDRIVLESSERNVHIIMQLDDAMGVAFTYLKDTVCFLIPFGEKRASYSPKAFSGEKHYLYVRLAREDEVSAYRNLSLNVYDQHENNSCYPHAYANVETRGEAAFAARNAIDGVCANRSHGSWPYESWGINMQDDAEITVDFGKLVEADKIVMYTRADFPHDNWWKQVTLTFSDGSSMQWELEKSELPHVLSFPAKKIEWVKLSELIKADDPSPFPALTQLEVYGRVTE